MNVIAPKSGEVYYSGVYWNDYPLAVAEINRRATGNPKLAWYDHFFKSQRRKFKRVLILNCGNGWLEREMYSKGYLEGSELVGVDFADDLLDAARAESKDMPFRYYKMDINTAKFPEGDFDLVINHAAAHHIAKLNKVFVELTRIMPDDGLFLNYDYVGPHRNQYPIDQWHSAHELNLTLPSKTRQQMAYPHLPTMLATDPSEAVHSELILPIMQRHFDIEFFKPVGGALAYLLLTHNKNLQEASRKDVENSVKAVMKADDEYTKARPEQTMFAYWLAKPKKSTANKAQLLKKFQQEEDLREKQATKRGGHYYDLGLIQQLYLELDELRIAKQHMLADINKFAGLYKLANRFYTPTHRVIDLLRQIKNKTKSQ